MASAGILAKEGLGTIVPGHKDHKDFGYRPTTDGNHAQQRRPNDNDDDHKLVITSSYVDLR